MTTSNYASICCRIDQLRTRPHAGAARHRKGDRLGRRWQRQDSVRHARVSAPTPAPTRAVEVILREPLTSIAAGYGVSLGITEQRKVVIWGANGAGIGGRIGAVAAATPQLLEDLAGVRSIVAGEFQFAAIDQAGALITWGLNLDGALGRPSAPLEAPPGRVAGLPATRTHGDRPGLHAGADAGPRALRVGRQRGRTARPRPSATGGRTAAGAASARHRRASPPARVTRSR